MAAHQANSALTLRQCASCGLVKDRYEFRKRKRSRDGVCATCVDCRRRPCACGCGELTTGYVDLRRGGTASRFVAGHHNRTPEQKEASRTGVASGVAAGNFRKSAATRQKMAAAKMGPLNPMYGNVEHMRRIAPVRGSRNGNYGRSAAHGKGQWYVRRDGSRVWLRSTWEVRIAAWLDVRGLSWEYERQRYEVGGKTYAPDFWIEEYGCYWEVKGWFHERHQKTVAAFRELHPELPLVVLTKGVMKFMFGKAFK